MLQKRLANKYAICYTVSIVTDASCIQTIFQEFIMNKVQKRAMPRLTAAIKGTMTHITVMNLYKVLDSTPRHEGIPDRYYEDTSHDDIDVAFNALGYAFPAFDSINDTDCRRCAKNEIDSVIEFCVDARKADPGFNFYNYVKSHITGEEVIEDLIAMSEDDE
jgi:hypothetical protein